MGFFDDLHKVLSGEIILPEKTRKELYRPWLQSQEEAARVTTKVAGKDVQKNIASTGTDIFSETLGLEKSNAKEILETSVYGKELPEPVYGATPTPLELDTNASMSRLRRYLRTKKGLASTRVSGGLQGPAPSTKGTLFTL